MAELLVKALDAPGADSDPMRYRTGDVVVIMPDGHRWGRKEGPPFFRVIRVPGSSPEELRDLLEEEVEVDPIVPGRAVVRGRRIRSVAPGGSRDTLSLGELRARVRGRGR